MRAKKWRRSGIALSIVWLLAAGYWANSRALHKGDFAVTDFATCIQNSGTPSNASGACLDRFDKDYPQAIQNHWRDALIAGVLPIVVAWLVVYGVIASSRRRNA